MPVKCFLNKVEVLELEKPTRSKVTHNLNFAHMIPDPLSLPLGQPYIKLSTHLTAHYARVHAARVYLAFRHYEAGHAASCAQITRNYTNQNTWIYPPSPKLVQIGEREAMRKEEMSTLILVVHSLPVYCAFETFTIEM